LECCQETAIRAVGGTFPRVAEALEEEVSEVSEEGVVAPLEEGAQEAVGKALSNPGNSYI